MEVLEVKSRAPRPSKPKPEVEAARAAAGGGGNAAEAGAQLPVAALKHTLSGSSSPRGCGCGCGCGAGAGLVLQARYSDLNAACLRTEKQEGQLPQDQARPDRLQHQALSTSPDASSPRLLRADSLQ
ncbi:hypothetical protein SRHO_G00210440 [Serrasalmus rhombeus]